MRLVDPGCLRRRVQGVDWLPLHHELRSKRARLPGGLRRRDRHAVAPVDVTAHDADAPPDRQRLGRRARPHDDARGGGGRRGRVLERLADARSPHPHSLALNYSLSHIASIGAPARQRTEHILPNLRPRHRHAPRRQRRLRPSFHGKLELRSRRLRHQTYGSLPREAPLVQRRDGVDVDPELRGQLLLRR